MSSPPPTVDSLSAGVQHLRLTDKLAAALMTPPATDSTCESQKSQKSTSNHSDHENSKVQQDKTAYIESLKEEREQLTQCSDGFNHVLNLLDKEIKRVAGGDQVEETAGGVLSEVIVVPVEQYPTYNFVGRILGPRGTTAKQLESTTGCRVTILGRVKKDAPIDPSAPIDNGPLRVQISVPTDAPDAARRMETGVSVVKALLIPPADGQDELKRQQLMVLANMNGTYRPRHNTSPVRFSPAGDYGHQFQNLLPYGYRLPVKSQSQHDSKLDCFNPKCAILRGLIDQNTNNNNNSIPKVEDVLSVMHMYELMNRIRLANSSLYGRQEEMSKAQEIGNRMCSSIGVPRPSSSSTTPSSAPTRRLYNIKSRQTSNQAK